VTITYLDMRVLRRAVEIAGGEAELALRLEVSPHRLSTWLDAHAPIPHAVFLRAVDIVLEHEHAALQRSGALRDRT
jgi:DNA-binding transcriptional regulator YdaS (Cro superfamily)